MPMMVRDPRLLILPVLLVELWPMMASSKSKYKIPVRNMRRPP
jgi:hypothetical protein